jgi:pimeloyl-ACP methyl ester carboxylesterase
MKTKSVVEPGTRLSAFLPSLRLRLCPRMAALLLCAGISATAWAAEPIATRTADVQGVKLHYLTLGHGEPLLLLHGYAETSLMWKPLLPSLGGRFTVIAPDLPGIGDSAIPADGLDMKAAAVRIHALMSSLGFQKAAVVGHDIGLMVAYAYAAMYPAETTKLVVMDAFLPGVTGWEAVYNIRGSGISASTGRRRSCSSRDESAFTSTISGTTSLPTRPVRSPKPTGRPMPPPIRGRGG